MTEQGLIGMRLSNLDFWSVSTDEGSLTSCRSTLAILFQSSQKIDTEPY